MGTRHATASLDDEEDSARDRGAEGASGTAKADRNADDEIPRGVEGASAYGGVLDDPPPDLPLRTRVRFEMAPGVPVPAGIGGASGHLEFRALRAFAAGGVGVGSSGEGGGVQQDGRRVPRAGVAGESSASGSGSGGGTGTGGGGGCRMDEDGERGSGGGVELEAPDEARVIGTNARGGRRAGERERALARRKEKEEAAKEAAATVAAAREEALEEWRKATLYWAHPATPLPEEVLAAQKAAHAQAAKNPAHATKARGAVHPGGSAATG